MGSEEPRALVSVKSKLFKTLDQLFSGSEYRYIILLADSGMGKTSASINYTVREIQRRRLSVEIAVIQLQKADAVEKIKSIPDKRNTILFLDAFDEDPLAIKDHERRINELMNAAEGFDRILVTSRTQFFRTDEEIPREVATLKVKSRGPGESAKYNFHKLYLSPFTKAQSKAYIRKRYPLTIFSPSTIYRRRLALQMADQIPHLATRPLLLTYFETLVNNPLIKYSFEVYEEMVKAWLKREEGFIKEEDELERFSQLLAVELFHNWEIRKGERIRRSELVVLATRWGIPVKDKQLSDYKFSTRSLLNRDADGNYKFAHRSIMEYLYVKHYNARASVERGGLHTIEWTEQMQTFYWEMLERRILDDRRLPFDDVSVNGDFILNLEEIPFLIELAIHGISQLRTPEIAKERLRSILETATAVCARLIDPLGDDDPVVSLIEIRKQSATRAEFSGIAIHHQGGLLDIESADLNKHAAAVDQALVGSRVPDIYADNYESILESFVRVSDTWHSFSMPITFEGELVALLVGETSRQRAFEKGWQRNVIDILVYIGKYLHEYRR